MAFQGYEEFKENRAVSGVGAGLYVKDETDGKYCLALLLETVPSVAGTYNTIEVDVTGSNAIGKILGKPTIDDKETTFLLHRDNILRLMELANVQRDWLIVTQDFLGQGFTGTVTYRFDDLTSSDSAKGTMSLTATSIDSEPILNVLPLLKKTVKFTEAIPSKIALKTTDVSKEIDVALDSSTATCVVTSDTSNITGTYSDGKVKLTITTGLKAGDSAIVKIKASDTGKASWTTSIVLIFE